jgi:hypothetical protein
MTTKMHELTIFFASLGTVKNAIISATLFSFTISTALLKALF